MKPALKKPFILLLAAIGTAGLTLAFILWETQSSGLSAPQQIAAILSLLLFLIVGVRAVVRWAEFWTSGAETPTPRPKASWKLFVLLLLWDVLILLLAWPLRCLLLEPMSLAQSMERWVCGDGIHYLDIARDWYLSEGSMDRVVQLVFLPGYPLLVRLFHLLIPNWTYAALTVSALCFAGAGTMLYSLLRLDMSEAAAQRGVVLLCLLPGSFFFPAAMSESLFLLCCVGCLYLARTNRWLGGCLLGGWAAFTRSLGITLLVPLVMELVHGSVMNTISKRSRPLVWLTLLLVPAGFGAYLLVNWQVAGNPFQFLIYQSEHWHQNLGFFFHTAAYQMDYATATLRENPHNFWGLWLPNLLASFAGLGIMVYGAGRLRASYSVWFLPYFFIAIGATWLLSAPRYLLAFFPLSAALAMMTERKGVRNAIYAILILISFLYFLAFLLRWQVY